MYPFLFRLQDRYTEKPLNRWVIKIAPFNYVHYDSSFLCSDTVGNNCLVLSVDESENEAEEYRFTSEKEALDFIRDWWIKQGVL